MLKMRRILATILCGSILLSMEGISAYADEIGDAVAETMEELEQPDEGAVPPNGYIVLPQEENVPAVHFGYENEISTYELYGASALESYYVTPNLPKIRNQNPYGTCWAFSAIALGELNVMQRGINPVDFSELQLAYFTYHSVEDPLGGTSGDSNLYSDSSGVDFLNRGGNLVYATLALAGWQGMAEESVVPYDTAQDVLANGLSKELAYTDVVHLKNAYYANIAENPEIVKSMIKDYGGVGISYCAAYEYDSEHNSYYNPTQYTANHAVTIVGWDDTFPKENFLTEAPGDGAWLIRNSWGSYDDEQNEYGYFWLSYYEPSIVTQAYAYDVAYIGEDDFYDNNYQYDGSFGDSYTYLGNTIAAANVFTAKSGAPNELLKAVSFSTSSADLTYEIDVYLGLTNDSDPTSGTLVASEEGETSCAGYYTIELRNPVSLAAGDTYSVVITLTAKDTTQNVYLDTEGSYDAGWINFVAHAESGQSFIGQNGYWFDYGAKYGQNVRIKAFTDDIAENVPVSGVTIQADTTEIGVGETLALSARILPEDATNRKLVWSSSDETVVTVDTTGIVTGKAVGDATITVRTEDGNYSDSVTMHVSEKLLSISLNPSVLEIPLEGSQKLVLTSNPADFVDETDVVWSSSDETIATVDSSGVVTGKGYGRATITAAVQEKTADCYVYIIPQAVTVTAVGNEDGSIEITWTEAKDVTSYYLYRFDYATGNREELESGLITSYTDSSTATDKRYFYTVYSEYNKDGYCKQGKSEAVAPTYTISYELNGGSGAEDNPTSFDWTGPIIELKSPTRERYIFGGWYYDSAYLNPVDQNQIDPYRVFKNLTLYAKWLEIPANAVTLDESEMTLQVGETRNLKAVIAPANVSDPTITWMSSNDTVATVDANGKVTAKKVGTAEIIASTKNGKNATCTVEVRDSLGEDWFAVDPVTYDGKAHTAVVELTLNAPDGLSEGTDYTVSVEKNVTQAGSYPVTITGKGYYAGSVTKAFEILPKEIMEDWLTYAPKQEYTGENFTPYVFVQDGTRTLQKDMDYTLGYEDVSDGEEKKSKVTVTGINNYTGSVAVTITEIKVTLTDAMICSMEAQFYSPTGVEPEPVVVYNGTELEKDRDYTVSYRNNESVGTATVEIHGIGNFEGTATKTFRIIAKKMESGMIANIADQSYTGAAVEPTPILSLGGETLEPGTDYTVSYTDNTQAGTATVTVKGKGNYSGSITESFCIVPFSMEQTDAFEISVDGSEDTYETKYTGNPISPAVSVVRTDGERKVTLEEETDYTVAYADNTNAGEAQIIISGIGNYTGSMQIPFIISGKSLADAKVVRGKNMTVLYLPQGQNPSPEVQYAGIRLTKGTDYEVYYYKLNESGHRIGNEVNLLTDAGSYEVVLKGIGNYTGKLEHAGRITVRSRELSAENLTISSLYARWDGQNLAAYYGMSYHNTVLTEGTDYTVEYKVDEKEQYVVFVFRGIGNYSGTVTKRMTLVTENTIILGESDVVIEEIAGQQYTGSAITPEVVVKENATILQEGEDYELTYVNNISVGTATVNVKGRGNYVGVLTKTFTIVPADAGTIESSEKSISTGSLVAEISENSLTYHADIQTPEVTVRFHGKTLKQGADYTVVYTTADGNATESIHAGNYHAVVTLQGSYCGTLTFCYSILPYNVEDLSFQITDQPYTGSEILPDVTDMKICLGEKVLDEDQKKEIIVSGGSENANVTAGKTAEVTLRGTGDFTGETTQKFEIVRRKLSAGDDVTFTIGGKAVNGTVSEYSVVWNGTEQKPEVTVTIGEQVLTAETDYTVRYRQNTGVGTARVTVIGTGNYSGSRTFTFRIAGIDFAENGYTVSLSKDEYVYNGNAAEPEVTVEKDGEVLKKGVDYSVSYRNNVNAGTAVAIVTGKGNYTGTIRKEFTICCKTKENADIQVSEIPPQRYTGTVIVPDVTITMDGLVLTEGVDYTTSTVNGIEVGTATLIISGIGNYSGVLAEQNFGIYYTTITYVMNGGENAEENPAYYTISDTVVLKDPKEKEGYTFGGWYADSSFKKRVYGITPGTDGDKTFYAKWNPITYKIAFDGNGNTNTNTKMKDMVCYYDTAKALTANAYSKKGYRFIGWEDEEGNSYDNKQKICNLTSEDGTVIPFDAQWEREEYTITFRYLSATDPDGATQYTAPMNYNVESDTIVLPVPEEKAGFTFAWYVDSGCTRKVTSVPKGSTGNKLFYGRWSPNQVYGIDVSKWQGVINWNSVRASGKNFAMLRISHGTSKDAYFETNYNGARSAGVRVGVYCFNEATTVEGAIAEAKQVLAYLDGRPLSYPIALDMESWGSVGNISNATRTDMVYAFKKVVEGAGYKFILYANKNWLDNYFDNSRLNGIDLWIARYCDYDKGHRYTGAGNVRIWQYSSKGSVAGISGNVDLDVCYKAY